LQHCLLCLSFLHNCFNDSTKLPSDLYLIKLLDNKIILSVPKYEIIRVAFMTYKMDIIFREALIADYIVRRRRENLKLTKYSVFSIRRKCHSGHYHYRWKLSCSAERRDRRQIVIVDCNRFVLSSAATFRTCPHFSLSHFFLSSRFSSPSVNYNTPLHLELRRV